MHGPSQAASCRGKLDELPLREQLQQLPLDGHAGPSQHRRQSMGQLQWATELQARAPQQAAAPAAA